MNLEQESPRPSLPETNKSHLNMDGWKMIFLFGRLGLFSGANLLLVLGCDINA